MGPGHARSARPAQPAGDRAGFGHVAVGCGDRRYGPVSLRGAQKIGVRRAPLGQHRCGHGEDLRRRAVVVVESDDAGGGVAAGEAPQQRRVRSVPRVDGLVGIADHTQVETVAHPALEEPELGRVDVLELVDEQVPKAPPLGRGEGGVLLEVVDARDQQVVEVHQPVAPLLLLVAAVESRHLVARAGEAAGRWRRAPPRSPRARPSEPWPTRSRWRDRRGWGSRPPSRRDTSRASTRTLRSSRAGGRAPRSAHRWRNWP